MKKCYLLPFFLLFFTGLLFSQSTLVQGFEQTGDTWNRTVDPEA